MNKRMFNTFLMRNDGNTGYLENYSGIDNFIFLLQGLFGKQSFVQKWIMQGDNFSLGENGTKQDHHLCPLFNIKVSFNMKNRLKSFILRGIFIVICRILSYKIISNKIQSCTGFDYLLIVAWWRLFIFSIKIAKAVMRTYVTTLHFAY